MTVLLALLSCAQTGLTHTLGWRPLLDPVDITSYRLLLLLPLALAISLVYKTIKLPTLDRLIPQTALLFVQIVGFMVTSAIVLWLVTSWA